MDKAQVINLLKDRVCSNCKYRGVFKPNTSFPPYLKYNFFEELKEDKEIYRTGNNYKSSFLLERIKFDDR